MAAGNCPCLMNLGCLTGVYSEEHGQLLEELYEETQVYYYDKDLEREKYDDWSIPELGEHFYRQFCSLPENQGQSVLTIPATGSPTDCVVRGVQLYANKHKNIRDSNNIVFEKLKESLKVLDVPATLLHNFQMNDIIQPVIDKFMRSRSVKQSGIESSLNRPQSRFEKNLLAYSGLGEHPQLYREITDEVVKKSEAPTEIKANYERIAQNIYEELPMLYKNTLLTKTSSLKAYENLNDELKSTWVELTLTAVHLSRRLYVDNLVIFPTLNTILVMKVYQNQRPARDSLVSKIIQLKLLQQYLPQRLGKMINANTRLVFLLAMPQAQNGVELLKKMKRMREACNGCEEYMLDANTNYQDWLSNNILQPCSKHSLSLDCLALLTLGMHQFVEGPSIIQHQCSAPSETNKSQQSCNIDLNECRCQCKMNLGLNRFSNLEVAPREDPLISVLQPYPCKFLKGPSEPENHIKQVMDIFKLSTHDLLDTFIAIPPDHEPFGKSVVNKSKSHDSHEIAEVLHTDKVEQDKQLEEFRSNYAEDVAYVRALKAKKMRGSPGFAMKNFNSANYLQPLKENARKLRAQISEKIKDETKSKTFHEPFVALNKMELEIIDLFKIVVEDKEKYINFIIDKVQGLPTSPMLDSISNHRLIKEFMSKFGKDLKQFDLDFTKEYVEYMLYKYGIQKMSMEIDTLVILPEFKLIIEVETKSITEESNIGNTIEKAKIQLENFRQFLENTQSDILTKGWCLVKAIALPLVDDLDRIKLKEKPSSKGYICDYCKHFVLDKRNLELMPEWLESITRIFSKQFDLNHEYQNLLTRLIGFSSTQEGFGEACLSLTQNRKHHEFAMIGSKTGLTNEQPADTDIDVSTVKNHGEKDKLEKSPKNAESSAYQDHVFDDTDEILNAKHRDSNEKTHGLDKKQSDFYDTIEKNDSAKKKCDETLEKINGKEIKKTTVLHKKNDKLGKKRSGSNKKKYGSEPICSLKTFIFWSLDQLAVVQTNWKRIILNANYGTGKTFLLKCKAQEVARKLDERVIYISLTALRHPKCDPETWKEPRILEVCDKIDFQMFPQVKVYGACDVVNEYAADKQITGSEMFVEMLNYILLKPENKSSHLFIDEIPTWDNGEFKPFIIDGLETSDDRLNDRYIWLALRPQSIDSQSVKFIEIGLHEWQKQMMKSPFFFRIQHLSENLRNTVNVFNFSKLFRDYKSFQTSSSSKLPSHSVPGNSPIIVRTAKPMMCSVRLVLEKYFAEDLDEPVVVLCTSRMFLRKLNEDLLRHSNGRSILFFDPKISADNMKEQEEKLRAFIKNPKGVLVTDVDSFGGMQARNVIVLSVRGSTVNTNSVLRCITSLIFISSVSGHLKWQDANQFVDTELSARLKEIAVLSTEAFKVCKSIVKDLVDLL